MATTALARSKRRWRAWPRPWLLAVRAALALITLVIAFHAVGGWYFASQIDNRALSGQARRDSLQPSYKAEVLALGAGTVTLRQPGEDRLTRAGTFGLVWDGGWGTVGAILETLPDGTAIRQFEQRSGTQLAAGARASITSHVFEGDPLTGRRIPFENVTYTGELGQYPAWYIAGTRDTWFVFVHGNGMRRGDALRIVPAVVSAGYPVLVPSYRNDPDAPEDPGGRLTYGKTEWRDLEAAVQYALDHGAKSVVIEGVSMGGAVTVAFLLESPLAAKVAGVVLESPLLDFEGALEYQAGDEKLPLLGLPLPGTLVDAAEWFAARRFHVDWSYTDYLSRVDQLNTPILLIHGADDEDVPVAISRELARRRPDLVRDFWTVPGAAHVEGWNASPAEYERRVVAFLGSVVR